jgi:hypothetical protein
MAVYMVAYDLHDGEDYNDLIEAIQGFLREDHGIILDRRGSSSASKRRSKSTIR